ncbi:hypothetical protein AC579_5199 [Pseudocercospora musae]|uniref:Uncharacterized protein n=1 Tax=Pseudocercospora musae TaxID=113226 RepID=A0A139IB39_9PEZI|nr:hypothetical protein AC579_5199 [Pseudocercospora musae]
MKSGGDHFGIGKDRREDVGFEEDQGHHESDERSEDDEDDGGFQDYEDWKEERRAGTLPEYIRDRAEEDRSEDEALEEWIQSIKQDSIDLGFEVPEEPARSEETDGIGKAQVEIQEDIQTAITPGK